MRLNRSLLILAAGLSAPLSAANITVTGPDDLSLTSVNQLIDNGGRVNNYAIGNEGTLTIDLRNALNAPIDATFGGKFLDGSFDADALVPGLDRTGVIVKTGGGTLQYNGFADMVYLKNATFDVALLNPIPADLRPILENPDAVPIINQVNFGAGQAFSGLLIIQQGQVQVSGHINQWADYGAYALAFGPPTMHGAQATVVENGAKISFRNTTRNLVGASVNLGSPDTTPTTPLVGRLNYLQNILGTTGSRVETGPDADYILVLHSDIAGAGLDPEEITETTLGILEGKGRVYKTGVSDLRITNSSTFDGEFVAGGGRVILAAGSGDTLWSALSVNLASGAQGANIGAPTPDIDWKPGYAPGRLATTLVVQGSQRVRNFQTLYQDGGFTSIINPGTGGGNLVELVNAEDILTVQHDLGFDGYFTGSFVGALDEVTGTRGIALGTLRKTGAGALALFSVGNNMSKIEVLNGELISNVQSLGAGEVLIGNDGALSIVQNDAGALRAIIKTAVNDTSAELRFKPTDSILYRGAEGVDIGNNDAGVADIVVAQTFFFGRVIVENGNAIVFSAGNNDAFINASSVELVEGATLRETSIRFNDTNQLVRNLQGGANTRVALGRGNITLTGSSTNFTGNISGVGNLIAQQPVGPLTLSGRNTYFGATVIQSGQLLITADSGIANTSGLILKNSGNVLAPSTFTGRGNQSVGALFGQSGTNVAIAGNLTVGISDELRSRLISELSSTAGDIPPIPAYYLVTDAPAILPGFTFTSATTLGYLVQQYGLATDVNLDGQFSEAEIAAYLDADLSGSTTLADLSAQDIAANRSLFAFSGNITLGGNLTKVGSERLALLGTVTFTGTGTRSLNIEGGSVEVAMATVSQVQQLVLSEPGTLELNVATNTNSALLVSGSGTFRKFGAGDLALDRGNTPSAFDGLYQVDEGDMSVVFRNSSVAGTVREGSAAIAAGSTFTAIVNSNLNWAGEVYGEGDFIKTGSGILTLTDGLIFTEGKVTVSAGGLIVAATPNGDLEIAAGSSYTADLKQDDFYDGVLTGAVGSKFTKQGDFELRLDTAAPDFFGAFEVNAGSLALGAANALDSASSITMSAGTTLSLLGGFNQTLVNVTADDATINVDVEIPGTELTFNTATGIESAFQARITGSPSLIKTGLGKLELLRGTADANVIQDIDVQAGELEADFRGLGGADVNVEATATLRFFAAADVTNAYPALTVTGTGRIAKSGAGTVNLSDADLTNVNGLFDVAGGILLISSDTIGGRVPTATIALDSTLDFRADSNLTLDISQITGAGSLSLAGNGNDIELLLGASGVAAYTGNTNLRDGVTVFFNSPTVPTANVTLGSISSDSGTVLDSSDLDNLTFNLKGVRKFDGTLIGDAALRFQDTGTIDPATGRLVSTTGRLDFTQGDMAGDLGSYVGTVNVSGAIAILSTSNTKAINLSNNGSIELTGTGILNYTAPITGSGTVALGAGADFDLQSNPATSLDDGSVTRLDLLTGSTLTISLSATSFDKTVPLSLAGGSLDVTLTELNGSLNLVSAPASTTVEGELTLSTLLPEAAVTVTGNLSGDLVVGDNITATTLGNMKGAVEVSALSSLILGTSLNSVTIGGDVTLLGGVVNPLGGGSFLGATLSGTGTIASTATLTVEQGATVRPGYSPGTITVGTLVNSGLLDMELGASAHDQIIFTGTAELNAGATGTLKLSKFGTGSLIGQRFEIITYQGAPPAPGFVGSGAAGRFSDITSPTVDGLRTLVFYPLALASDARLAIPGLVKDGEVAVYVVRASSDYATLLGTEPYLAAIQKATRVDLVTDVGDPSLNRSVLSNVSPTERFTAFGARLAILNDAALLTAVDNLRPRGHASVLSGAAAGFRSHADNLQRRLEQRRFDGADMSVKTTDWFVDATQGQLDLDNNHEAKNTGASAGTIRPMGIDGYWAVSLGVENHTTQASTTKFKGNGFRVGGAFGVMNPSRSLSLDAGLSLGLMSGDLTRPSLVGGDNVSDPSAATLGLWVRASAATSVGGFAVTPFVALEHSRTTLDKTTESDAANPLGDSLTVGDTDHDQTALRAGCGIHHSWVAGRGGWRYRLSLEAAYALQIDGDEATLVSNHAQLGGGDTSSTFTVLPGDGLSLAPSFTFGPSVDSTFSVGLRLEQGSEGEATSLQFGYRRKF